MPTWAVLSSKKDAQASGRRGSRSPVVIHLTRQLREPPHYAPIALTAQFAVARAWRPLRDQMLQHPSRQCVRQAQDIIRRDCS